MKTRFMIVAVLILLTAIVHTAGGELTDIKALIQSAIAANLKMELRAVWYLVAADLFFSAGYLIFLIYKNTIKKNRILINFIGIRIFCYGCVILFLILVTDIKMLFQVPQWILLIIIGILTLWDEIYVRLSGQ